MGSVKSILIVGGSGFIGTQLALKLREAYKVYATYFRHPQKMSGVTYLPLSAVSVEKQKRVIYLTSPDVVIYAAGNNKMDWAGANTQEAEHVHVQGPLGVLKAATSFQPKFIYLSSCYAFDGSRGNYHESDHVNSPSALGKLKSAAEGLIRSRSINYSIVRSSPVIGRGNGTTPTFLDLLRLGLGREQKIEVDGDDLHSIAPASGLIELISKIVEGSVRNKTYHYGGLSKATHFEFARAFATKFGFDPDLVQRRIRKEDEDPPGDFSLNSTETVNALKIKPLLMEECLDLIDQQLVAHA
jgi:dTDP-4-dehydrorhamnose reductase